MTAQAPDARAPAAGWVPWFGAVALAYALTWAALPSDGFWINDNGAKLIQTQGLIRQGYRSLAVPWPGLELDPTLTFNPIPPPIGKVMDGKLYVTYSAVFALAAAVPYRLFGVRGLYLLPLAGTLLTLVMVWKLAGLLPAPKRGRPLAVVLAGLGSPLWFYGFTFWEHAPATGLAMVSIYFMVRPSGGSGRLGPSLAAGVGCGLAAYFRADLLLLAPALVAAIGLGRGAKGRARSAGALALGLGFSLAPLLALQAALLGAPFGLHLAAHSPFAGGVGAFLAERWTVARGLLLNCHDRLWVSLLVSGPYLALMAARPRISSRSFSRLAPWLIVGGVAGAVAILFGQLGAERPLWRLVSANGLFSAAPFAVLAFFRSPFSPRGGPGELDGGEPPSSEAGAARVQEETLFILACYVVISTGFSPVTSVGVHWGCRFLLLAYPLLAALAGSNLGRGLATRDGAPAWRAGLVALVIAASIGTQLYSLYLLREQKSFSATVNRAVAERAEEAIIARGWFVPQELAGNFYRKRIFLARDAGEEARARALLKRAGYGSALRIEGREQGGGTRPAGPGAVVLKDGLNFIELEVRALELGDRE